MSVILAAVDAGPAARPVLETALRVARLTDSDVLMAQTGCLFPCNHGPVAVVHPEGAWYGPVGPDDATRLVREHLAAGRTLDDLRLPGTTAPPEGAP